MLAPRQIRPEEGQRVNVGADPLELGEEHVDADRVEGGRVGLKGRSLLPVSGKVPEQPGPRAIPKRKKNCKKKNRGEMSAA